MYGIYVGVSVITSVLLFISILLNCVLAHHRKTAASSSVPELISLETRHSSQHRDRHHDSRDRHHHHHLRAQRQSSHSSQSKSHPVLSDSDDYNDGGIDESESLLA
eukprot:Awhi_evm1s7753